MKISKVILYDEPTVPEIKIEKLKEFITKTFKIDVEIKENFFRTIPQNAYEEIATCRIFDLKKQFKKHNPTLEETQIEKENRDMSNLEALTIYDGFEMQNIITKYIPKLENTLQIIFTNKLTATFDDSDFRYHARASINSDPSIISTTGMVEAPAKPKQYYLDLMTNFSEERISEIKDKYRGEFLEYNDIRLNEIAEGYLLQAVAYFLTGEEFCPKKECRLYNAHWQKDLFYSQIENKQLCDHHEKIINKYRNQ